MLWISSITVSSVSAIFSCMVIGSSPSTKYGFQPQPREEVLDVLVAHTAEDGGVGDLVAVQVQDGQHSAVATGFRNLLDCQEVASGPVIGFAVADGDGADQVGVVKHSAERMGDGIAQLAAFVDGTGGLGRNVGRDAAGEAELLEQLAHALFITADVGYTSL